VSQGRLREGGRGRPAQWILEGHAEWVKFKVVDLLGYRAYAESRDIMVRAARESTIKFFPDLPALINNAAWTEATRRLGAMATYGQAFLAVDWLVEQYGSAKLLEFLDASRSTPIRENTGGQSSRLPTASSLTSSAPGWRPWPTYAAGRSGQPGGIARLFFSMIAPASFSR